MKFLQGKILFLLTLCNNVMNDKTNDIIKKFQKNCDKNSTVICKLFLDDLQNSEKSQASVMLKYLPLLSENNNFLLREKRDLSVKNNCQINKLSKSIGLSKEVLLSLIENIVDYFQIQSVVFVLDKNAMSGK